jgi:predicted nucleic acid-binding Zn ribbon protein
MGGRKRLKKPIPIRFVLDDTLKGMGLELKLKQHQVFALWSEVVGSRISNHTQPTSIRGGRLFVAVEDSMWLHQLSFLKHQILSDLNGRLGPAALSDLVLRVGEVKPTFTPPQEGKGPLPARGSSQESNNSLKK